MTEQYSNNNLLADAYLRVVFSTRCLAYTNRGSYRNIAEAIRKYHNNIPELFSNERTLRNIKIKGVGAVNRLILERILSGEIEQVISERKYSAADTTLIDIGRVRIELEKEEPPRIIFSKKK